MNVTCTTSTSASTTDHMVWNQYAIVKCYNFDRLHPLFWTINWGFSSLIQQFEPVVIDRFIAVVDNIYESKSSTWSGTKINFIELYIQTFTNNRAQMVLWLGLMCNVHLWTIECSYAHSIANFHFFSQIISVIYLNNPFILEEFLNVCKSDFFFTNQLFVQVTCTSLDVL